MIPQQLIDEVQAERDRQDAQWGGPAHDDRHRLSDWWDFIGYQMETSLHYLSIDKDYAKEPDYRARLVKVAALALAALESIDRQSRSNG